MSEGKKKNFGWIIKYAIICIVGIAVIYAVMGFVPGLTVSYYTYSSSKLPASFDGFKILQISDFHLAEFGEDEKKLVEKIDEIKPDIIVFTGDMIDGNHETVQNMTKLVSKLSAKYKLYQVNGDHEGDNYTLQVKLEQLFTQAGTVNLNNTSISIKHEDGEIVLHGLDWIKTSDATENRLKDLLSGNEATAAVDIMLCHNPDVFPELSKFDYEIVLSGHNHGGIVRLPIIGGLYKADGSKGVEYDTGVFQSGLSTMIVSSGLGKASEEEHRFQNKSELVVITLKSGR